MFDVVDGERRHDEKNLPVCPGGFSVYARVAFALSLV
jgi:hypothetical protein